jgi:hypothetical protein
MIWCCADFESHLLKNDKSGVGLMWVYRSRVGYHFFVQHREEGAIFPKGGFAIEFCPFCGKNLREWLDTQAKSQGPADSSE